MEADADPGDNHLSHNSAYGISGWMKHNFERLNTSTDFEKYASSPPETEGFLAEYGAAHQNELLTGTFLKESSSTTASRAQIMQHSDSIPKLVSPGSFSAIPNPALESIKSVDLYSSPDCSPCVTPESSPSPQRKFSSDSVSSNPQKWFYQGFFQNDNPNCNKQLKQKIYELGPDGKKKCSNGFKICHNDKEGVTVPVPRHKRFNVSNFDINAVSPTSW